MKIYSLSKSIDNKGVINIFVFRNYSIKSLIISNCLTTRAKSN